MVWCVEWIDRTDGKPQHVGPHDWYYEDKRGIEVIHEVMVQSADGAAFLQTDHVRIPWTKLVKSFARKNHRRTRQHRDRQGKE